VTQLLDLDLVAGEVERARRLWTSMGLEASPAIWSSGADQPRPASTERETVAFELRTARAAGQVIFFGDGRAAIELRLSDGSGFPVEESQRVSDAAGVHGVLKRAMDAIGELTRDAFNREEPELPVYGLVGGLRASDGFTRGPATSGGVWDAWHQPYSLPDRPDDALCVYTQRRAIHRDGKPLATLRVTGPVALIRSDAARAVMLRADDARLVELRRSGDTEALRERVNELVMTADRIGEDDHAWRPAPLTIDGEPVEAVELDWEGWWVLIHVGVGKLADVYVFGPPGSKPEPLELETITPDA
jgi:hypothetical protein